VSGVGRRKRRPTATQEFQGRSEDHLLTLLEGAVGDGICEFGQDCRRKVLRVVGEVVSDLLAALGRLEDEYIADENEQEDYAS
jgi:hypothetical protein